MVWYQSKLVFASCCTATLVGTLSLSKDYLFGGPEYEGRENLFGRTYVVTGATSGIGRATAEALAARGARVILTGRNDEEGSKAASEISRKHFNRQVVYKHLDLASLSSIRSFAQDFITTESRLDALVNNAGVKEPKKREFTEDGFELQLGVNYLGHFLLTNLLIGKLSECSPSRIVNLTDICHRRGKVDFDNLNSDVTYNGHDAYKQSKLAQALFTKELGRKLTGFGVHAYGVHPGIVRSRIDRNLSVYSSWLAKILIKPFFWLFHKTPEQGARTVIYCLLSPDVMDDSGCYFKDNGVRKWDSLVEDADVSKRLWMISEVWTGLKSISDFANEDCQNCDSLEKAVVSDTQS